MALTAGSKFLEVRNRALILMFMDTGLRLAEMTNIQLADLDFDSEVVKVMGKGSKERFVRFGKTVQKALLRYITMRTDAHDCLWVTEERQPIHRDGIRNAVKSLLQLAEATDCKLGPHAFRHYAATTCLRNGMPETLVQQLLGHSTPTMTRRYTHMNTSDLIKAHIKASPVDNLRF
jgi:site-specific recombinase XerD